MLDETYYCHDYRDIWFIGEMNKESNLDGRGFFIDAARGYTIGYFKNRWLSVGNNISIWGYDSGYNMNEEYLKDGKRFRTTTRYNKDGSVEKF